MAPKDTKDVDRISPSVTVQVSAPDGQGRMTPLRALHADLLALSQEEREQAGNNLVVATAPDDLLRAGAQPEDSWMIRMLVRWGVQSQEACFAPCSAQLGDCSGPSSHLQQPEESAQADSGTTQRHLPHVVLQLCTMSPSPRYVTFASLQVLGHISSWQSPSQHHLLLPVAANLLVQAHVRQRGWSVKRIHRRSCVMPDRLL